MERLPFKVVFVSDWQIKVQHSLSCQLCWVSTNSWGKTSDPLAARWQLCSPASCQCRLSVAWCWAGSVRVIKPIHLKTCRAERNWRVWETIICGIVTTSRAFWTLLIMIRPIVWMKILILITTTTSCYKWDCGDWKKSSQGDDFLSYLTLYKWKWR